MTQEPTRPPRGPRPARIPPPVPIGADGDPCPRLSRAFLSDLVAAVHDCHAFGLEPTAQRLALRYGFPRDRLAVFLDQALQLARDAGGRE